VRIATWNVNSIKQRIDSALAWLAERKPDIVCLQETKCVDDAFPREPFEALGYNLAVHGQKTFNGVALLSKFPFDEVNTGLPGDDRDGTGHWTARVPELGLVGVVSVMPEAVPWQPELPGGWRLRGMATAPEVRGWGIGSDLVDAVVDHVLGHAGTTLWCTARLAAVGFYERSGFTITGDPWEEPVIGIHIHMHRPVSRAATPAEAGIADGR